MKKYEAFGTQLQMSDMQATPAFTTVAGLTNIEGPGGERAILNATSHDSPNKAQEKLGGILDAGQVSIEGYYDPAEATHNKTTGILEAYLDGVARDFKVIDVDDASSATTFKAIVRNFQRRAPHDGLLGFSCTLEVTGVPVYP